MKTPEAMVEYLAEQIGLMYYYNPLMYGGSPAGVETLLCAYHEAWAHLVDFDGHWRMVYWDALQAEDCGGMNFAHRYSSLHPAAPAAEVVAYVVKHWRTVSEKLGVPIPHDALEAEFREWRRGRQS